MVKIAFTFDKEVADFLNGLSRSEVRAMRLSSNFGVRAFPVADTENYAAVLEFPGTIEHVEDEPATEC